MAVMLLLVASTAWAGLPTVSHDGHQYVPLSRLASLLKARLEASADSPRARLVSQPSYKQVTIRNWHTTTTLLQLMDARG